MADHEYTGHVDPGGEPVTRDLRTLQIRKISVGPMDNNSYLLTCRSTGAQLLIDAAADADALRRMIAAGSEHNALDLIVTTHSHHDHVGALAEMISATGARTAAGAADAKDIAERIDEPLAHGDVLEFGEQRVEIIHLRGHTPARSRCSGAAATRATTCSPATPCSPAGWATRSRTPSASPS